MSRDDHSLLTFCLCGGASQDAASSLLRRLPSMAHVVCGQYGGRARRQGLLQAGACPSKATLGVVASLDVRSLFLTIDDHRRWLLLSVWFLGAHATRRSWFFALLHYRPICVHRRDCGLLSVLCVHDTWLTSHMRSVLPSGSGVSEIGSRCKLKPQQCIAPLSSRRLCCGCPAMLYRHDRARRRVKHF